MEKSKNIEFENCKELIGRFLNPKKIIWPREIKICKQLFKLYPFEFLKNLKDPFYPIKMDSLCWFLSEHGKNYLTSNFFEYNKDKVNLTLNKEPIKLNKEKIGKDIKIENKPESLQDFLGMYKK